MLTISEVKDMKVKIDNLFLALTVFNIFHMYMFYFWI